MTIKNIYVTSEIAINSFLKELSKRNIQYVYIKENKELHFEDNIYRFNIKSNASNYLMSLAINLQDSLEENQVELPSLEALEPIVIEDKKFYQHKLSYIKESNRLINQKLKSYR